MIKHYTHNLLAKIAKSVFLLAIIGLSLTKANAQLSGGSTYTINGTNNYPTSFRTFGGFVNYLNTAGTSGSGQIIVEITSGQVDSVIPIMTYLGNITRPILFRPASGNTVTITTTTVASPAANTSLFRMNGTKYFTIDGSNNGTTSKNLTWLVPSANGVTTNAIIGLSAATDSCVQDTIKNCIFIGGKNNLSNASAGIYTYAGVYMGGATTYSSTAASANNNRCAVINNTFYGVRNGIVIRGNSTLANRANGWTIANNIIGGTNTWEMFGANTVSGAGNSAGILMSAAINCRITGNNIGNTFYNVFGDLRGIELGTSGTYCSNISIDANKIYNLNYTGTGGYGTYGIFVNMGAQTASNIAIANNMISGLKGDTWSTIISTDNVNGIRLNGTSADAGVFMYYNSINLYGNTLGSSTTDAFSIGVMITSGITGGVAFNNNIIRNTAGNKPGWTSSNKIYGLVSMNPSTSSTCFSSISNNSYYVSSTGTSTVSFYGYMKNANQSTFANLTSSTGEANTVNINATFADSNDLHLNYNSSTATLLESGGLTISGLNFDYDNQVRPGPTSVNGGGTAPDIGADERDMKPLVGVNVGVLTLLSPTTATIGCGDSNMTISVRVKNFNNTYAIDCAVDTIPIKVVITGTNAQTFTIKKLGGKIAANGTFDTTLTTTYNMSANGTYNFKSFTELTYDVDKSNDTLASSFSVNKVSSFPYTIDFETSLPSGWTNTQLTGTGLWLFSTTLANPTLTPQFGSGAAYYNSYSYSAGTSARLGSPCLDFTSLTSPKLEFYMSQDNGLNTYFDTISVAVSTNNGASYSRVQAFPRQIAGAAKWTKFVVDLSAYAGQVVKIGLDGLSNYGNNMHLDRIKVYEPAPTDMGVTAVVTPTTSTCGGSNQTATVTIKNTGTASIDFSVKNVTVAFKTTGAVTQTFSTVLTSGTLASGATNNVNVTTTLDLSANGTYNIKAWTEVTGDGDASNDTLATSATKTAPISLPVKVNFENAGSLPSGWSGNMSALSGHGNASTYSAAYNLYSTAIACSLYTVKYGPVATGTNLAYDYRIVDWSSYPTTATTYGSGNYMLLKASFDCGATYVTIDSVYSGMHTTSMSFATRTVDLSAYSGSDAMFRFEGTWASGDYYFDIDNFRVYTPPATDISAISMTSPSPRYYGTNKTITFKFKNTGLNSINFSTNNLVVTSSVSGPISQTFTTTTVSSGTLAHDSSINVTVSTTCDLSTAGNYTFKFKGVVTGDGDNSNDSTGSTINVFVPVDYSITRTTNVAFNSIMGSGNSFGFTGTSGDDQTSGAITMPFTFNYQGQNVASFRACTNGWMTLNGASVTATTWSNAITSNSSTQNAILAPFWDDLVCTGYQAPAYYSSASQLDQSLKYLVTGTSPNRILTVEWAGMEKFSYPGPNMNFQVKLYENGSKIQYIYGNMGAFDGTSIGEYSYSIGMNSFTTTTAGVDEVLSLQQSNSSVFTESAKDNLSMAPACYSMYEFTSGTHGSGTVNPAITNDESTGALTLSLDTDAPTEYCAVNRTEGATNSGIAASSGNADDDVWFTFTLPSSRALQFDLRSSPSFDGVFQIFNSGLTQVTPCINKTGLSLTEDTIINLSAGTYYVRVFHSGTGSGNTATSLGDFALFAYDAPITPFNDNMNGMILLNSNTSCVLSSTQRTTFANGSSQTVCTGTASKDIWYYFQAGYSAHTVTVTPVAPGTTFNPVVQIFNLGATADTTNAISGNQVACQNNSGTNASEVVSLTTLVPGNFYAVRVYHFLGGAGGTGRFKICVANPVGFWAGNSSSSWPLAANWSNGVVPTSSTNVRIGAGRPTYPIISSVVYCNNLIVDTATSLTINNGGNLQVSGTITAPSSNFTYNHNSGWLTLNAATNLPAWNYFALRLNASTGTYTMLGNTTVNDYFINNGAATVATAGFTLTCKKDITNNGTINGSGKILSQRSVGYSTFTGISTGTYENVEIDATSGVARFAQNMQINGTLTLTSGMLVINPSITITVGTTSSSTGNIISGASSSIIGGNSATSSTLAILGNASAPQITNFKFSSNGNLTLNRPNGVKLGANSTIGSILTLTNGSIEQNGFNLNLGSTSLSTVAVNRTFGKIKNSQNTGTLFILGNAGAANLSTLNLDTVNSILINIPNGFTVDSLFYVKSLASITKGFVNLNGSTITLGTNASVSEAANQTFRGSTGSIKTTRNFASALSNNNVAGLGLKLSTSGAPGVTTLTRKHNVYTSGTGISIKRNFTVSSANTVTASLFEMSYDTTELSGADRGKLRFNKSTNSGASWSNITGCTPTTANNPTGYVNRNGVVVLNSTVTIYTLSDSANTPLSPVFTNNTSNSNSYTNQINGVYPNPFINELTIDFVSEVNSLLSVRMTDINGKVVYNGNFATQQGQNLMNINGANLASGVYLITLMNNIEVKTIRVIKQ